MRCGSPRASVGRAAAGALPVVSAERMMSAMGSRAATRAGGCGTEAVAVADKGRLGGTGATAGGPRSRGEPSLLEKIGDGWRPN
jgi:hypothetical protein